ncbi:MAG: hypothetical protein P8171_17120 [Candidatus Thiodiazotropha sp.]
MNTLAYFIVFFVIFGLFLFAYVAVTEQNAALIMERDSLKGLKSVVVEVCEYHGVRISNKCHVLDRESGLELFQSFLSSSPTLGPSKAKKIQDKIIRFTGNIFPNKSRCICYIGVVFESLPNKMYFSSFLGNRECNEIVARQGGRLVSDIKNWNRNETGSE